MNDRERLAVHLWEQGVWLSRAFLAFASTQDQQWHSALSVYRGPRWLQLGDDLRADGAHEGNAWEILTGAAEDASERLSELAELESRLQSQLRGRLRIGRVVAFGFPDGSQTDEAPQEIPAWTWETPANRSTDVGKSVPFKSIRVLERDQLKSAISDWAASSQDAPRQNHSKTGLFLAE